MDLTVLSKEGDRKGDKKKEAGNDKMSRKNHASLSYTIVGGREKSLRGKTGKGAGCAEEKRKISKITSRKDNNSQKPQPQLLREQRESHNNNRGIWKKG